MSITASRRVNGNTSKRRKVSHDSTTMVSEPANNQASDASGESHDEHAVGRTTSKSTPRARSSKSPKLTTASKTSSTSSSTLMLQTQRFLDDSRPSHASPLKKMRPVIDRIIDIIKAIPEQQPMSYAQVQSFSQKTLRVTIPWTHRPATDIKYSFQFIPPSKVTHHWTLQDNSPIFIVPEMPAQLFQEKDYLNHRCLHKRAVFLASLAAALHKDMGKEFDLVFSLSHTNSLLPVINLTTNSDAKAKDRVTYEISPSFPESIWPIGKMTPLHNCIRKQDLANRDVEDSTHPTPLYNSTIRHLSSMTQYNLLIETATAKADSFRDSCLLAGTWLQQRGFSSDISQGGFGHREWSTMCMLLLESGGHQGRALFSPRYSTVQFFKAMLQVLSGRDMLQPFVLRGDMDLASLSSLPIFFDAATGINVLYKMTPWSYARLKHFATLSLAALNSRKSNNFDATFVTNVARPPLEYDEIYQLDISSSLTNSSPADFQVELYELLKQGFGDRAQLIDLISPGPLPWKITSSTPQSSVSAVTVGILVNAEATTRLVDHGPPVEEKEESQAFRTFWGDKSELRKFKDGRICESLVWSADVPVTQQIIQYLCGRYLKTSISAIRASHSLQQTQLRSVVSADEAFATINTKFQALSSTLHHLDGLPLPIRSVSAASEAVRSASTIPPLEPGIAQPIDAVIQFDTSGRWPDNLQAIQYTKIAFLTKIGDLLTKQDRKLEVRVGIENASASASGHLNTSFLDVVNPSSAPSLSPIIFRLRIYHEREMHLVQQSLSDKTLRPHEREGLQFALQSLKQNYIASPAHTTAIRSLITQFPPLSATIRLLKSWISAHHLSQHIPAEILEVIATHVFLHPTPWSVPGTPTTAFARCLHLLSQWNWSSQPLLVDLSPSQDMTIESRNELETRFAAWRQMDPNMNTVTWFIGTSLDGTGVVWTQGIGNTGPSPPRVIASRLTALASAAIGLITSKTTVLDQIMTKSDWASIFTSTLDDFDFTIHLTSSLLHGKKNPKTAQFKNLQLAASLDVDTTGIDAVQCYIDELTSSFGNAALFFYGGKYSGSDVICGLWRPGVRGRDAKPWKIRLGYSSVPVHVLNESENGEGEGICTVNFEGMLSEMGMMGEGLVERINVKET